MLCNAGRERPADCHSSSPRIHIHVTLHSPPSGQIAAQLRKQAESHLINVTKRRPVPSRLWHSRTLGEAVLGGGVGRELRRERRESSLFVFYFFWGGKREEGRTSRGVMHSFIHSFIHPSIHSGHSSIHPSIHSGHSSIHPSIHPLRPLVHPSILVSVEGGKWWW